MPIVPDSLGAKLLDALRADNFADIASDLEVRLAKLDSPNAKERKAAVEEIVQRCHPRWLGDVFLPSLPGETWLVWLGQLRNLVESSKPQAAIDAPAPDVDSKSRERIKRSVKGQKVAAKAAEVRAARGFRDTLTGTADPSAGDLIRRLESRLKKSRGRYLKSLGSGLSEGALVHWQQEAGFKLPAAFQALYRWRGGQGAGMLDSLQDNWMWIDIAQSLKEASMMRNLARKQASFWKPGWVPFLSNGTGDFVCVDLEGAFQGKAGQILEFHHDDGEHALLHPSFRKWLETLVLSLERLTWKLDCEGTFKPAKKEEHDSLFRKLNPGYPKRVKEPGTH